MTASSADTVGASETISYASSLRAAPVEVTQARAEALAATLGITRVTDITHLDRPGIPVFASIRPGANPGSLCVNAGKGVTKREARIGAYMEAIEFALAEPGATPELTPIFSATGRDILDERTRPDAILDLCPRLGVFVPLDEPMDCVAAERLSLSNADGDDWQGGACLLPAALVFLPEKERQSFEEPPDSTDSPFCATSNGLASGNTVLEATVHGLAEVIERDFRSFQRLGAARARVDIASFPPVAAELAGRLQEAGLWLCVHAATLNPFGMPYFAAQLYDPQEALPFFYNFGYGCHPHRSIALVRALCEAAQSRLSCIHGGRDDLEEPYARVMRRLAEDEDAFSPQRMRAKMETGPIISYEQVPDLSAEAGDIASCFAVLKAALRKVGATEILRVRFTDDDSPLQVVRIVAPRLEDFSPQTERVGPRLREYLLTHGK